MSVRPVRYPGKLGAQGIIARGGHLLVAERSRPDAPGPREDRDPLVLGPRPEIWTDRPRGVCFVAPMLRLWEAVAAAPKPAVLVFKDISPRNSHACHCGDVMANTAYALGAIGLVTDGGIRDLEGVAELGFHYFAPGMTPAHGRFQVVDVNIPVVVSEVEVVPGDLIHGDANGVVKIPLEIAADLPRAAAEVVAREQEMIDFVRGPDFSLAGLRERFGLAEGSVE